MEDGGDPGGLVVIVDVPSNDPAVFVMTVQAGETWSFSAAGRWTNGWIKCGPDGYRNFLADALQMEPTGPKQALVPAYGQARKRAGLGGL